MKPDTSTGSPRTKKYLASCLAALMAMSAPMGHAADSEDQRDDEHRAHG